MHADTQPFLGQGKFGTCQSRISYMADPLWGTCVKAQKASAFSVMVLGGMAYWRLFCCQKKH